MGGRGGGLVVPGEVGRATYDDTDKRERVPCVLLMKGGSALYPVSICVGEIHRYGLLPSQIGRSLSLVLMMPSLDVCAMRVEEEEEYARASCTGTEGRYGMPKSCLAI